MMHRASKLNKLKLKYFVKQTQEYLKNKANQTQDCFTK